MKKWIKHQREESHSSFDEKLRNRNNLIKWGIMIVFAVLIFGKIAVTPFEIDFSVFISFLLAVFSITISFMYYAKMNELSNDVKRLLVEKQVIVTEEQRHHVTEEKVAASEEIRENSLTDSIAEPSLQSFSSYESPINESETNELETDETEKQIEAEKTLKLKEEERKELLERLIHRAGLNEEEKRTYMHQLEEVDNDLFNVKHNLNLMKKKFNSSFSDMFPILERSRHIRDVVQILDSEFVVNASFQEMNQKFALVKEQIAEEILEFLEDNDYIDAYSNITRKGYREFLKIARKVNNQKVIV